MSTNPSQVTSTLPTQLFNLLPAIYRVRDSAGVLANLFAILQDAHDSVDNDIAQLYENWFIETCAEWVVPYIGDLLGVPVLQSADIPGVTARGYVADTLSYRRRKGTAAVLEQLARDVTNWPACAVECFQLLSTTQHMQHVRLNNIATVDLRQVAGLTYLGSAWDTAAYTADVRGIGDDSLTNLATNGAAVSSPPLRGKPNLTNVALYLWRLASYAMQGIAPAPLTDGSDGRYFLHPAALAAPLFNAGTALPPFTAPSGEQDIPALLSRLALASDLEVLRQSLVDGNKVWAPTTGFTLGDEIYDSNGNTQRATAGGNSGSAVPAWATSIGSATTDGGVVWQLVSTDLTRPGTVYFGVQPVLRIFRDRAGAPIPPEQISICDLDDVDAAGHWRSLAAQRTYTRASTPPVQITLPIQAAVDPQLGRLGFTGTAPDQAKVRADYSYGFSGELGGGPYSRAASLQTALIGVNPNAGAGGFWQVAVSNTLPPLAGVVFADLASAVTAWNALPVSTKRFGVIVLLDNSTYAANLAGGGAIQLPEATSLLIVGAGWPSLAAGVAPTSYTLSPQDCRPYVHGSIACKGTAPDGSENPGSLLLNGLLIGGSVTVAAGNLGQLQMTHCTLIPAPASNFTTTGQVVVQADPSGAKGLQNEGIEVQAVSSIMGPITFSSSATGARSLSLTDSIVGNNSGQAIGAPQADATIQACTILGAIGTAAANGLRTLTASNSIFTDIVNVERTQTGCARYSSFTQSSIRTPRRFRCQPDLALSAITDPAAANSAAIRLTPSFTSLTYGDPAYAQLSDACAPELRAGADDGSEMGAFSFLKQPQRDANLRSVLGEYLRPPFQAGIFYVN